MITYTNYTNLDAGYLRPYEHGDRLVMGWHGTVEPNYDYGYTNLEKLAEMIFAKFNQDDRPDGKLCPSMSIGDVVVIGEVALSVDRTGFVHVDLDPADIITNRTWKEMVQS